MAWTAATTRAKITTAHITELQAAVDKATPRTGSSTTNGTSGRSITLSPVEASAAYDVYVVFTEDPGGDVGAVWVPDADKAVGSFKVYNVGITGKAFRWVLVRQ